MALPAFKQFRTHLPSVKETVEKGLAEVLAQRGAAPGTIKAHFSEFITEVGDAAYSAYLVAEEAAWEATIPSEPISLSGRFEEINDFFLSLGNSRKTRGGAAFEDIIRSLFRRLDYPFEEKAVVNGIPDFLLPNAAHYVENAPDSIIFTAKRSLRERWKQITTEATHGHAQYLATLDRTISQEQLGQMLRNRVYLVVPKEVKASVEAYSESPTVKSFEQFFEDSLDPAMVRWRRAGIVP